MARLYSSATNVSSRLVATSTAPASSHQPPKARRPPPPAYNPTTYLDLPKYQSKVPSEVTSSRKICPSLAAVAGRVLPCSTTTCHPPLLTRPVSARQKFFLFYFFAFYPVICRRTSSQSLTDLHWCLHRDEFVLLPDHLLPCRSCIPRAVTQRQQAAQRPSLNSTLPIIYEWQPKRCPSTASPSPLTGKRARTQLALPPRANGTRSLPSQQNPSSPSERAAANP